MPQPPDRKSKLHPWEQSRERAIDPFSPEPASAIDDAASDNAAHPLLRTATNHARYAELHVTSNFTFLTGASHPDELVQRAAALGLEAVAITDVNTLAGIVRAHVAAKEAGIQLVVGCHVKFHDGLFSSVDEAAPAACRGGYTFPHGDAAAYPDTHDGHFSNAHPRQAGGYLPSLLLYPTTRDAYARLCRLLTIGKRRAPKGECHLTPHDLLELHEGMLAVVIPPAVFDNAFISMLHSLRGIFDEDRLSLAAARLYTQEDDLRMHQLMALSEHVHVPLVATNDVHYHVRERRPLQDVVTCIRHGCTISEAGYLLFPHAERCLKSPHEMARLFADCPEALERSVAIARRCRGFNLDQLQYEYPDEVVRPGATPMQYLRELTETGARQRYPAGVPDKVRKQIEHEMVLIDQLNYAPYFLTVYDIVQFAESRGILCQGRGAAANSAVCYCLRVTAVDPDRIDMLFERFVSKERNEPPDIDIDFEHERREEVIQYIYEKYGRDRAALTAEVISYRARSSIREVGTVMGLSLDCVDRMAKNLDWFDNRIANPKHLRELGLNPDDPTIQQVVKLATELMGFPRHLSQHVGGFVITRTDLCEMVPIENAAMEDRTVIEWDKDDIDAMGMLKVDVLGLGMLTCLRKGFELLDRHEGTEARRHEAEEEGRRHEADSDGDFGSTEAASTTGDHIDADQDIPGSCGLAERDGASESGLCQHAGNADRREVRTDPSDASGSGVRAVKHRRGIRATEPRGLPEIPSHGTRITCGTGHAVRTGDRDEHAADQSKPDRPAGGNGPRPARPDPQPAIRETQLASFSASCLRASVPSCLYLAALPPEDPHVYDMICDADTVGVFQIESRAQMSMLPRLKPRCYYDLVIEVAIVRPGPIQGNMVHPYLRRRNGEEEFSFPDETIRKVLGKTLGVPLFQEQAMSLAIVAAGFTPGEADQLRRAIAAWKSKDMIIDHFAERIVNGMVERGYSRQFGQQCFEQIKGFGDYGFPESHAASFALLVYASAWIKCYYPAVFACALINSQPMGFYAPAQIVRDAKEHDVQVRPVDVNWSGWDCRLEGEGTKQRGSDEATERRDGGEEAEGTEARPRKRHKGTKQKGFGCSPALLSPALHSRPQGAGHKGAQQAFSPGHARGGRDAHGDDASANESPKHRAARHIPPGMPGACESNEPAWSPALRLGMRLVKGVGEAEARRIEEAVARCGMFESIENLWRSSGVKVSTLRRLAAADAFNSMGLDRQAALWRIRKLRDERLPLYERSDEATERRSDGEEEAEGTEARPRKRHKGTKQAFSPGHARGGLGANGKVRHEGTKARRHEADGNIPPGMPGADQTGDDAHHAFDPDGADRLPAVPDGLKVMHDYLTTGLSLKAHPLAFHREALARVGVTPNAALKDEANWPNAKRIAVAGIVLVRQRPGTASGVVFMTIEDETGVANLILRPRVYERFRRQARHSVIAIARGKVERQGKVAHVMVERVEDFADREGAVPAAKSRDFH